MSHPTRRALIVIDVQNEYFSGGLPIEYPDPQASLANIGLAMDSATAYAVPVLVVQQSAPAGAPIFAPGTHGWELHESVARRPRSHLIDKQMPSAFTGTGLVDWLETHAIDTLTVVGYMTHNCVASTVFEALHRGLKVEVLHDATGALPYANRAGSASAKSIHEAFHVVFQSRFAAVMGTAEWLAHLAAGSAPERDSILASNRRFAGEPMAA